MTEREKQLYNLLARYKQYAYDLDRLLQGYLDDEAKEKYRQLEQDRIALEAELERISQPAMG